jgi:outer membrane protein OmpA-like peptidoglycan-associated protein
MRSSRRHSRGTRFVTLLAPAVCALALAACSQHSPSTAAGSAAGSVQTASAPSDVQVFFDDGSATLSDAANRKLDQTVRLFRGGHPIMMYLTGYADSSGGEYPNLVLSGQRAQATKDALVARGIPADRLQLEAMGSSLPHDPNAPVPENNRRVVITWR